MTYREMLEEYFEAGFASEPRRSKYYLIKRYWSRVSSRLKTEAEEIRAEGKKAWQDELLRQLETKNSFMGITHKDHDAWAGSTIIIPLEFK
jgi:hypothetical protein